MLLHFLCCTISVFSGIGTQNLTNPILTYPKTHKNLKYQPERDNGRRSSSRLIVYHEECQYLQQVRFDIKWQNSEKEIYIRDFGFCEILNVHLIK